MCTVVFVGLWIGAFFFTVVYNSPCSVVIFVSEMSILVGRTMQFSQRSTKLFSCYDTQDASSPASSSTVGGVPLEVYDLPPASPAFRRRTRFDGLPTASLLAVDEAGSLAALVVGGRDAHTRDRVLILFDVRQGAQLTEMIMEGPILAVRITTQRLAVILAARTHLYQLPSLAPLPQVVSSPPNIRGLGALSPTNSATRASYFAWPHRTHHEASDEDICAAPTALEAPAAITPDEGSGTLVVLDTASNLLTVVPAFEEAITCIEFAPNAETIAVCSTSGTVIKVFAVPSGELAYTFRRGTTTAIISRLSFSPTSSLLLAASRNGTLHIFDCDADALNSTTKSSSRLRIPSGSAEVMFAVSADDKHLLLVVEGDDGIPLLELHEISKRGIQKKTEFAIR